ncbi:hypothetical protein GCM10009642_32780 [Nocardiopsis metallicus]
MVRAGSSAAVSAPGEPGVRNPHLGVVRCFRNPLTPDDLATRGKFGAELAPGSKIIFEEGAETGPGGLEGRWWCSPVRATGPRLPA